MSQKQMRIGMSLRGHGYHLAAWRHPDVPADASVRLDYYIHTAQTAERGKCDLIFFADGLDIRERDVPRGALARQGRDIVDLDPLTLPALAMVTHHIGLVATASTTYYEPYHVARTFASLDLISQGRAGWNVVTSWSEAEAQNFNRDHQLEYATWSTPPGTRVRVNSLTSCRGCGTPGTRTPSSTTKRRASSMTNASCMCSSTRAHSALWADFRPISLAARAGS
jgi:luciferase-like monooxygenase